MEGKHDGTDDAGALGGEADGGVWFGELSQDLTAGTAGWAGGIVQVDHGCRHDAYVWTELYDGPHQGGAFCANRQAVADVFYVGPGDDFACGQQQCGTDPEAGVGRVGLLCRIESHVDELGDEGSHVGLSFCVGRVFQVCAFLANS